MILTSLQHNALYCSKINNQTAKEKYARFSDSINLNVHLQALCTYSDVSFMVKTAS